MGSISKHPDRGDALRVDLRSFNLPSLRHPFLHADVAANTSIPFAIIHLELGDSLRLDLDKRVFLDPVKDEEIAKCAQKISDFICDQYRSPHPLAEAEHGRRVIDVDLGKLYVKELDDYPFRKLQIAANPSIPFATLHTRAGSFGSDKEQVFRIDRDKQMFLDTVKAKELRQCLPRVLEHLSQFLSGYRS
jgi:hypothetical protein